MDRLTAAKVFLETVARGSISAAANHLDMSRAMATRYIGLMEEWAEVRLLHRTTRKLSLTTAGEQLLPVCKELVALSADIKVLGSHAESAPKGLLRVTAPSIFAEYCLTDVLMEFLQLYPGVAIDLQIADSITNLAQEGIDLAVRVTDNLDPGLIAKKLGEVDSFICASPAYLQTHGLPADVRDLAVHNCLTYAYYGHSLWHFLVEGENVMVPVTGSFSTNEASIIVRAALSGTGVAMLPHFAAKQAIEDGRLIRLFPEHRIKPICIHAVYLSRQRMSNALRTLIDFLSGRLAN